MCVCVGGGGGRGGVGCHNIFYNIFYWATSKDCIHMHNVIVSGLNKIGVFFCHICCIYQKKGVKL